MRAFSSVVRIRMGALTCELLPVGKVVVEAMLANERAAQDNLMSILQINGLLFDGRDNEMTTRKRAEHSVGQRNNANIYDQ